MAKLSHKTNRAQIFFFFFQSLQCKEVKEHNFLSLAKSLTKETRVCRIVQAFNSPKL